MGETSGNWSGLTPNSCLMIEKSILEMATENKFSFSIFLIKEKQAVYPSNTT